MTSGNPLLLRQLLRALEDEGIRPDVAHVDTVRAVGSRAVSALVTLRLRRMPAAVTSAARAVAVLGDAAGLHDRRGARAAARGRRRGRARHPEPERDPHRRAAAGLRPPAGPGGGPRRPPRRRARLHHERAATILQRQGAPPEQVVAHLLRAPRRGSAETVALLRAAGRGACPGVPRTPPSSCCAARSRSRWAATSAPGCSSSSGWSRPSSTAPPGPPTCWRPSTSSTTRASARCSRWWSPGSRSSCRRPGWRPRSPGRPLPQCLPRSMTSGRAWSRCTGSRGSCTAYPTSVYRSGPTPVVSGEGDGARMLAATLSYELLRDGADRARATALARFSLEGDRLLAIDNGLLWIVAANVLLLADEDLGDFWDRALARAHATGGSLRRPLGQPVARVHPVALRPGRRRALVAGRRDRAAAHVGHLAGVRDVRRGVHARRPDRPGRPGGGRGQPGGCSGAAVDRGGRPAAARGRGAAAARGGPARRRPSNSSPRPSTTPRSSTPRGRRGAG